MLNNRKVVKYDDVNTHFLDINVKGTLLYWQFYCQYILHVSIRFGLT